MLLLWFVRSFLFFKREKKTRSAPNAQRDMRHTLNSWNVPFRLRKVKQTAKTRNPPYSAETARAASSEHCDRKYGWAELWICVRMYAIHVCLCMWNAHLYFILLYIQTIRNTDPCLFVIPCTKRQWMDACKMMSVVQAQHTQTATRAACTSRKNQAIQLQNLSVSVWIRAHIWDKNRKFAASVRSCYASNTK